MDKLLQNNPNEEQLPLNFHLKSNEDNAINPPLPNTSSTLTPAQSPLTKLLYISIFLLIIILIEYLTRDYSKQLTLSLFCTKNNKDLCHYLDYYEFYIFGGRYLLCFLIFSYVNIYSALTYMFLDCFVVFINGIIRFFYLDDRPFWKHPEYTPCFCATDYGNPSTTGLNTFIMFAVFYKAFTYKPNTSKVFKWVIWLVCVLNVAYLYLIRMIQNIHYLHQLLFGLAIGYVIYYIVFDVIEVDFDSLMQFKILLEHWVIISLTVICTFVIVTFVHMNLDLVSMTNEEIKVIEQNCKLNDLFSLDKESYSKSTRIFEFLGCYIGCCLELWIVFKSDWNSYLRYNVIDNKDMYRNTNGYVSFIRFAFLFITQQYLLSYLILGKSNFESFPSSSFGFRIVFLQSIPLFIHGVLVFFAIKTLMSYIYLTNESIKQNEKDKGDRDRDRDKDGNIEERQKRLLND